jgi:hypothetical protein
LDANNDVAAITKNKNKKLDICSSFKRAYNAPKSTYELTHFQKFSSDPVKKDGQEDWKGKDEEEGRERYMKGRR